MTHVGVEEHPRLCPGDLDTQEVEKKSAHPLKQNESGIVNTVGCHVILKHKDTNKRAYAIIPACNKCNKADRSKRHHDIGNLRWYCKAVTILEEDASKYSFVGKITVPGVKDSKGKKRMVWWQDIMDIMDVSADGTTGTNTLTIRGYTNIDKERPGTPHACNDCKFGEDSNYKNGNFLVCSGCKRRQYTYSNPAGYLQKIAYLWKYGPNVALGNHGVLKIFETNFNPRVLRCQEEMYPGKNPVEYRRYKKAYGLCTNKGCHKDSLPRAELCKEHLLVRKYFARWRDEISKRRARAAEAVANEVLNILLKQLDDLLIQ